MPSTVDQLSKLMVQTLRALGNAGEKDRACQLAAQAWALLQDEHEQAAERMNGVLHYLTATRHKRDEDVAVSADAGVRSEAGSGANVGAGAVDVVDADEVDPDEVSGAVSGSMDVAGAMDAADADKAPADFDLEVRHLVPAERHELIIDTFHELVPGQGFILINDHDPKPLYYQFAFEYTDRFTWDPIEEGPDVWRVRIGKK